MTEKELKMAMPGITVKNLKKYLPVLNSVLSDYGINTPIRLAHFLAQIGHETLSFYYYREIGSGIAYECRKDLGNTQKGDGVKFKGRGAIQITGRSNYLEVSKFLFGDDRLLNNPELLELPEFGIKAACWFWTKHNLNKYADEDNIIKITKKINGGINGLKDRKERLLLAKKAFNI
ncbi:MAG: glycoside hydrolase family 19 protein [Sedimentibacter sp.]